MSHPMETGQRRGGDGQPIPAHYITELTAKHNDKIVLAAEMGPSVSTNPYLSFKFKGGAAGDTVEVSWKDNKGESRTDKVQIR
jgi:sulfur-oxidizing protein SoxZ